MAQIKPKYLLGGIPATKLADGTVTDAEFQRINSLTSNAQDQLDAKVDSADVGVAGGVASLDGGGKVPASQLPNSIMDYKGTWAASTNTPTLADGVGNAGDVYIASDAGTVNFGAGPITFAAGDWVIYDGAVWQKSVNSNAVASVNGMTGAVVVNAINELTGEVTTSAAVGSQSKVATLDNAAVIGKVLTGFVSGAGVVSAADSILQAIQKLNGNIAAIPAAATNQKETITLDATDITNGYVDLADEALADSLVFLVEGAGDQLETIDYSVSVVAGPVTRITWTGLGLDGLLADGDVVQANYLS